MVGEEAQIYPIIDGVGPYFFFCAREPLDVMAPAVSPADTPMAVISPWRLISIIGIMRIATA